MNEHDWTCKFTHLEDRAHSDSSIEAFTLYSIDKVREAKVHVEVFLFDIVRNWYIEWVVSMAKLLDLTALFLESLNCFIALQKEVDPDGLEDLL